MASHVPGPVGAEFTQDSLKLLPHPIPSRGPHSGMHRRPCLKPILVLEQGSTESRVTALGSEASEMHQLSALPGQPQLQEGTVKYLSS